MQSVSKAQALLQTHIAGLSPGAHVASCGSGKSDVAGTVAGRPVAVMVHVLGTPRTAQLLGLLARGTLEVRHCHPDVEWAVAVMVPRVGPRLIEASEHFMGTFAADVGWALFDDWGGLRLEWPHFGFSQLQRPQNAPTPARPRRNTQLFTDLNRWMLKVLLAFDRGWNVDASVDASVGDTLGPFLRSGERPENGRGIAAMAGVSTEKAYRFLRTLEGHRFVRGRPLQLQRVGDLLDSWLRTERDRGHVRTYVRGLFGPALDTVAADKDILVGGFAACERHGLLHRASVGIPELHVQGPAGPVMERLELAFCPKPEADYALIDYPWPYSVFRGAVFGTDGAVDPWQAALDVVSSGARGEEQASFIRDSLVR